MKINAGLNQSLISKDNINTSNSDRNLLNGSLGFKSAFADAQVVVSRSVMQELIDKFEKQEKTVIRNPTISNIYEYRKIIKEVLSIAAQNYKTEEMNVYSGNGYQKNLSVTDIIDEKLNAVVEDFMSSNKLSLESISNMAEIKGLILDVFV